MKRFKEALTSLLKEYGIIQKSDDELMISYEVIYESDVIDAHGNWASRETLTTACDNFNTYLKSGVVKPNLFHLKDTDTFTIEDTWIQKELDVVVEATGEKIKAGTWIAKLQFHDPGLWELKKAGVVGGVSVGCVGVVDEETGEIKSFDFSGSKSVG